MGGGKRLKEKEADGGGGVLKRRQESIGAYDVQNMDGPRKG